ncbi:hypothetical protein FJY94_00285 [Candidatus Kaiserbacteria bacterium]|nr:hypothetical protein [Candidatus Kaiserbacteria bacterium]
MKILGCACALALLLISPTARAHCSLIDFIEKPHISERAVRVLVRMTISNAYEIGRRIPGPHYVLKPEVVDRLIRAEIARIESARIYCVTFP